jgi:hypothetical protein
VRRSYNEPFKVPCIKSFTSLIGNQVHLVDFVKELLNDQEKQYQHLLKLASEQNSHAIQASIKKAQAQQLELKHKFDELEDVALTSTSATTSSPSLPSPSSPSTSSPSLSLPSLSSPSLYQMGMKFVLEFKQARIKQGKERMDWKLCMKEGQKSGLLLNYKNISTLKNQFMKFEKSQKRMK